MIFKKPYGFLIKHFKIIHIILTLLTIYIAITTRGILSFFRRFISNGYSITVIDNMASEYVNWTIYVTIILVIISLIAIFILLRTKKKPNKIYLAAIIYYFILLIAVIISYYLISSLNNGLWSTAAARTYRDIAQMIYYPQFLFIIILGIRSLGFNVKQFDFRSDMRELEITEADSEEVELNINFETYKAERFFRRLIRELYYYYIENKLIVNIIFIVIVLVTIFLGFKSYEKVHYTYEVEETFNYKGFNISVKDSMLTNIDSGGNEILKDRYYLVLKLEITNNNSNNANLDYNNLKIYVNEEYINPTLDIGNYFYDFGNPFMNQTFSSGETQTYIIPYMLTENQVANDYRLSIYTGSSQNAYNFMAITMNVNIHPTVLMDVEVTREAQLNEYIDFSSTYLGNSSLAINNVEIANRYEYSYESCSSSSCRTYTGLVIANAINQIKQTLIIADYDLLMDQNTEAYKNIKDINTFSDLFISVEYVILDQSFEAEITNVTPSLLNDKLVLQVPELINDADEVNLLITIRNRCYTIKIK